MRPACDSLEAVIWHGGAGLGDNLQGWSPLSSEHYKLTQDQTGLGYLRVSLLLANTLVYASEVCLTSVADVRQELVGGCHNYS